MIINKFDACFDKITLTRGKKHVFLGMNITHNVGQTVVVNMKSYLQEAIDECRTELKRNASMPARRTLFEVEGTATHPEQEAAKTFHRVVAKLLYVLIRVRMDLLLAIGFLCIAMCQKYNTGLE